MKKIFHLCCIAAMMIAVACGGKKEKAEGEEFVATEHPAEEMTVSGDAVAQGEALVKSSDCKTCHHVTNKIIGPSHTEVAKKYDFTEANVKMLAEKIIKGGTGVWGQVPMSPHSDISQDDAEKMARYVLSLDGEKEDH